MRNILLSLIFLSFVQKENTERIVLHKYSSGKAKMVVYVRPGTAEIVFEEVFFDTGRLNWSGTYKKDVEHGAWTYYWPNGKLKISESYQNGLEEGVSRHYNQDGKLTKEITYSNGSVIKEVSF